MARSPFQLAERDGAAGVEAESLKVIIVTVKAPTAAERVRLP